jgi:hypothetical protein
MQRPSDLGGACASPTATSPILTRMKAVARRLPGNRRTMAAKLQIYPDKHNASGRELTRMTASYSRFIRVHSWLIPLFGVGLPGGARHCRRLRYADIGCIKVGVTAVLGGDHEI